MKILLSGASGFIGKALSASLREKGHSVIPLIRGSPRPGAVSWDPSRGVGDPGDFEGFDALIHLAGENIASGRWTKRKKEQIFLSRCRDTWLLAQILIRCKSPPKTVISASAIGIYGDRGKEILTEESLPAKDFLADLCVRKEAALESVEKMGCRVVHARFGIVLSPQGGMLAKMLPLFRLGLGARLGSGEQMMSWITLADLIGALEFVLKEEKLRGPVNFTAPHPISQAQFAQALAAQFGHKLHFCIPAFLLRWLLGEMADELLLVSAAAIPKRLMDSGYVFQDSFLRIP